MKLSAITLGSLGILLSLASTPASAANANKKFCLNPASGGSSCGYDSMEQCQQTMRGRNGWCSEQVDFKQNATMGFGRPADSFAYDPPNGSAKQKKMSQQDKDMDAVHERSMPSKGVGAE
jgi:hypothetical protein